MRTTTSKSDLPVELTSHSTRSNSLCEIIEFSNWRKIDQSADVGSMTVDSLVAEYERDPQKAAALARARNTLAPKLSKIAPSTLRELRLQRGISQATLAKQISSTQAQIARVESGRHDVQISTIVRMAQALDIDPIEAVRGFLAQQSTHDSI